MVTTVPSVLSERHIVRSERSNIIVRLYIMSCYRNLWVLVIVGLRFSVILGSEFVTGSGAPDSIEEWQFQRGLQIFSDYVRDCKEYYHMPENFNVTLEHEFQQCFKVKVFDSLDQVLDTDLIYLVKGVELVKTDDWPLPRHGTNEIVELDWRSLILNRLSRLFHTHVIQIRLNPNTGILNSRSGKHAYKLLFPLMVVIFMKMMGFLVPLGFQFMAMIGGKALLLSKMALLLASVQGLKNVAHVQGWQHPMHHGHSPGVPVVSGFGGEHHFSSSY